jgi:hypothetical protein
MTKYLSNYFAIFGHFRAFSRENTIKKPRRCVTDAPSGQQRITNNSKITNVSIQNVIKKQSALALTGLLPASRLKIGLTPRPLSEKRGEKAFLRKARGWG